MKGAKFTWKIENFSCLKDGVLQSPSFSSYSATWEVRITPSGNQIDLELHRVSITAEYSMKFCLFSVAVLDFDASPILWRDNRWKVENNNCFTLKKDKLRLQNDILILECRIWTTDSELMEPDNICFGRTCLEPVSEGIEETFTLKPTGHSLLGNERLTFERLIRHRRIKVKVELFLDRLKELQAEITLSLVKSVCKCKISVLDAAGKHIVCADEDFVFDTENKRWLLSTQIKRAMMRCYEDKIMPNNTLTLVFAFAFPMSYKVLFSSTVTENEMSCNLQSLIDSTLTEPEIKELNENSNYQEPSNISNPPVTVNQVLRKMYEEGYMSDFSFQVEDRTFPVHKAVLGARSSVFDAMFTLDMKEKASGSVNIPDMDADTVQKMLKFVYCDSVQHDMPSESACSLYAAADKYAIQPLKQRCSSILKSRLCVSNVLGALLLGATYHDQDLETAALVFIAKNDKFIVGTEPWSKFEKDNPQIALDAFRKLYVMKMNG